jgi:phosphohistidine phosphatase SixA
MIRFLLATLLAFAAGAAAANERLSDGALVQALRGGGYNIYFRHAETEWSQQDRVAEAGDWTSCDPAEMRQLSDAGRDTAAQIGDAIRALRIPVGKVMSSEYCRTAQTAEAMDLGPVERSGEIMNMRAASYLGGREAVTRRAREVLSRTPAAGGNTVLVAHGNLMRAATGEYTGEAGAVVVRPDGQDFAVMATLLPDDWARLAERFARP